MKKLLFGVALGLCTVPAMAATATAATAHPLENLTHASATGSKLPDLPLPPLQAESSLTLAGFGKGGFIEIP